MQPALFLRAASGASGRFPSRFLFLLFGLGLVCLLLILLSATGTRLGAASAALSATCTRFGAASAALLLGGGQIGTCQQAADTEPGKELFQLLLVHPVPPFKSCDDLYFHAPG